jgi:AcrR family transcriptional regulator
MAKSSSSAVAEDRRGPGEDRRAVRQREDRRGTRLRKEAPATRQHEASSGTPQRDDPRGTRQRAEADARRSLVLDAARAAFFELGLDGASMREIAKRAGYTPGAIYSYYASKEEMYGALLGESLERLNARFAAAVAALPDSASRSAVARSEAASGLLRAAAGAFFDFFHENPRDLDLGFYLVQGMQPRGLTPALNERLNARLGDALAPAQRALVALGLEAKDAQAETTALFAHSVGLLVLSHTGRIRMFRQESRALFERYLDALLARAGAGAPRRRAREA